MMKSIIKVQLLLCLAVLCVLPASAGKGRGLKPLVVDDDDSTIFKAPYAVDKGIIPYRLLGARYNDQNVRLEYDAQGKVKAMTCLKPQRMDVCTFAKTHYTYGPKVIKAVCEDLTSYDKPAEEHLYYLDNKGRVSHSISTMQVYRRWWKNADLIRSAYGLPGGPEKYVTHQTFYSYDGQGRLQEIVKVDTLLQYPFSYSDYLEGKYVKETVKPDTTVWHLKWDSGNVVKVITNSSTWGEDSTVCTYTKYPDSFGLSMFGPVNYSVDSEIDAVLWVQGYFGRKNANLRKSVNDDVFSYTWGGYGDVLKEDITQKETAERTFSTDYFWEYQSEYTYNDEKDGLCDNDSVRSRFMQILDSMSLGAIEEMVAKYSKAESDLLATLLKCDVSDYLNDYIGTRLLAQAKFQEAIPYLERVSMSFLEQQPAKKRSYEKDPWTSRGESEDSDEVNEATNLTVNQKLNFCRDMIRLNNELNNSRGIRRDSVAYKLAAYLYQSYTECWYLREYHRPKSYYNETISHWYDRGRSEVIDSLFLKYKDFAGGSLVLLQQIAKSKDRNLKMKALFALAFVEPEEHCFRCYMSDAEECDEEVVVYDARHVYFGQIKAMVGKKQKLPSYISESPEYREFESAGYREFSE